jgi:membrane protease YdiL (CAAX protease family)
MQFKSVKGFTGWAQLGILLAFVGLGLFLAAAVQIYFGMKALGPTNLPFSESGDAMIKAMFKPENATYAQLSQIFSTFFLLFVPSFLFIIVCYKKFLWAGFSKYFTLNQIGIAFLAMLTANFFSIPFEQLSKSFFAHFPHWDKLAQQAEQLYDDAVTSMSTLNTWPQFFVAVFIIAFLPALFEEFFFRGVLQNLLVRWLKKPVLAITIASIIFSLIHASYYLFISRFVLGYVLGLLFYQSKNIWVNTFAHFLNNFLAIVQLFIVNTSKIKMPGVVDAMDPKMPTWSLLITFTILFILFKQFNKISAVKRVQIEAAENLDMAENNPFANDINHIGNFN